MIKNKTQKPNTPKKVDSEIEQFLRNNPQVDEALRLFDISYEHYQKVISSPNTYTDTSANHFPFYSHKEKKYGKPSREK